jgi:DNA polymerase-4
MEPMIRRLAHKTWSAASRSGVVGRTVVLKLKTRDFHTLTRSHTPTLPPASEDELLAIALRLRERVEGGLFRLAGVGLSNFDEAGAQAQLFDP